MNNIKQTEIKKEINSNRYEIIIPVVDEYFLSDITVASINKIRLTSSNEEYFLYAECNCDFILEDKYTIFTNKEDVLNALKEYIIEQENFVLEDISKVANELGITDSLYEIFECLRINNVYMNSAEEIEDYIRDNQEEFAFGPIEQRQQKYYS